MKAMIAREFGGPEVLALEDAPSPEPGPGEARVRVKACGVNFADTLIIQGKYQVRPDFPFSPGLEIAGVVDALGEGTEGPAPGTRVVGVADHGGYAEEVVIDAARLAPLPDGMSFTDAAAFPVAYGTSHMALTHKADLKPGETVLVLGAAGGVGLTAVEIAKKLGATVIAAASSAEKLEVARAKGADHLIDISEVELREAVKALGRGVDVVYDPVGGAQFEPALKCLNFEGRYLVIGFASGDIPKIPANLILVKNIDVLGLYWGAYARLDPKTMAASFAELMAWRAEGAIAPHVSAMYPLERAADALDVMMARRAKGKLVITME